MNLLLKREFFGDTCTVGKLYNIVGENADFICYTLEDKYREVDGQPVSSWKVQNKTAIPKGTYDISITFSNRFQCKLPLLANVDGYSGVRIHTGNTSSNTEGCILVGMTWDGKSDWIASSKIAFSKLFPLIEASKTCSITIQ